MLSPSSGAEVRRKGSRGVFIGQKNLHFPDLSLQLLKMEVKVKQSRYTPWRRLGGEEVQLLLILDLGTRWG
jgi:hypothetical protein